MLWTKVFLFVGQMSEEDLYWPKEKNKRLEVGDTLIVLLSVNMQNQYVERILSVMRDNSTRIVTHMQVAFWSAEYVKYE